MKNIKKIATMALTALVLSTSANAAVYKTSKHTVVNGKHHKTNHVIVTPGHGKHHRDYWRVPRVPNWNGWRGNKVVIVDRHHHHYNAFEYAMGFLATAIVIDAITDKPYTEEGKEVIVKERKCDRASDSGKTEVVDLDDMVILLVCE